MRVVYWAYACVLLLAAACSQAPTTGGNTAPEAEEAAFDTVAYGRKLFVANCAACHQLDMKMVGPALAGISKKKDRKWLYTFIRNSQEMIKSGDHAAMCVADDFKKQVMPPFPQLTNEDMDAILAYTK